MRGKKSGLNLGLRKILAKIAREFDFPAVYAVRCRIEAAVRKPDFSVKVVTTEVPSPTAAVTSLLTQFPMACVHATLEQAQCHTETTLEQITTTVASIPCYEENLVELIAPPLVEPVPEVKTTWFELGKVSVKSSEFAVKKPDLLGTPMLRWPPIRGGALLARSLPFHMKVVAMGDLNKRLLIRFRAAVLKQLNLKPTQVKFVGVVRNLPNAPLSILKYEEATTGEQDRVVVRIRGNKSERLARRTWVFVRLVGRDNYLPVTVLEEEE